MTKIKRLTVNITKEQFLTLERLREKLEIFGYSDVVRQAINLMREKYLDNYKEVAKAKMVTAKTPEERIEQSVKNEEARQEAKEKLALEKQTYICHSLGGEVTQDGYCAFPQFVEEMGKQITIWPQREPIENMTKFTHETQFMSPFADEKTPESRKARIYEIASLPQNKHIKLPIKK